MERRMHAHPELITTASQVKQLAETLRTQCSAGSGLPPIIAFDTEFIRETTFYPVVEIIQIATRSDSWLVDARAFLQPETRQSDALRPLLDIFQDKDILKVAHAI